MQFFLVMFLNETMCIQCDQFHVLSPFSAAQDFHGSSAAVLLQDIVDIGFQYISLRSVNSLDSLIFFDQSQRPF